MRAGRNYEQFMNELVRQNDVKRDYMVRSPALVHHTDADGVSTVSFPSVYGGAINRFEVNDIARGQMAQRLEIPGAYFDRMRRLAPELLDRNVNTWLQHHANDACQLRTLDGKLRAFLSSSYKRIDNFEIAAAIFPALRSVDGLEMVSLELTETRMYIKAVSRRLEFEVQKGDVVQAGVVITNSEVGYGKLRIDPLIYRLVCDNGAVALDLGMSRTHVGRKQKIDTDEQLALNMFQDDTLKAEDAALLLKARDMVNYALSQGTLELLATRMRNTLGIKLTGDPVEAVARLGNRFSLDSAERIGVLRCLFGDPMLNAYGLVNAVTAYSKLVPSYDRATELEVIGGDMLSMRPDEWAPIMSATAAAPSPASEMRRAATLAAVGAGPRW